MGDEPVPAAGEGMSLVRVTAVGICGPDLHWWDDPADDVIGFRASVARRKGLKVLIEP